jgi:hypothetical protein
MQSATQGIFGGENSVFMVSAIPKALFRKEANVFLAGRVLGKIETTLPILGKVMIPHLKFVEVHFCKDWQSSDLLGRK